MVGDGDPTEMGLHGPVNYHVIPRAACLKKRAPLEAAFGRRPWPALVIHGWTPRETVRRTVAALRSRARGPTIIHLEDNEDAITEAYLDRPVASLRRERMKVLDRLVPRALTHPLRGPDFVARADGVTVIVEKLLSLLNRPERAMILSPGAESVPALTEARKTQIRGALGLALGERMIVYPGNMHPANRKDLFDLYQSVEFMNQRGMSTRLIRTGEDHCEPWDISFTTIRASRSIELGFVPRYYLLELLACADLLIQPGGPGPFNDYRLPSKLPDFMASGRPVILPNTNIGLRLTDGVNAILLEKGDADDIATKAIALMNNPAQAQAIGAAGARFAQNLSWDVAAQSLLDFYVRTLSIAARKK